MEIPESHAVIVIGGLMKVPDAQKAVVDVRKLCEYCLNFEHEYGRHKARLFAATLGMTAENAQILREFLLEAVKTHDAKIGRCDIFGQRYSVDFSLEWRGKQATVRSAWIIEHGEDVPRLTSCYPLAKDGGESE